jgi:hypothetical protein
MIDVIGYPLLVFRGFVGRAVAADPEPGLHLVLPLLVSILFFLIPTSTRDGHRSSLDPYWEPP